MKPHGFTYGQKTSRLFCTMIPNAMATTRAGGVQHFVLGIFLDCYIRLYFL